MSSGKEIPNYGCSAKRFGRFPPDRCGTARPNTVIGASESQKAGKLGVYLRVRANPDLLCGASATARKANRFIKAGNLAGSANKMNSILYIILSKTRTAVNSYFTPSLSFTVFTIESMLESDFTI